MAWIADDVQFRDKLGYWFGCGSTQCLITGYDAEEEAFGLIDGYEPEPWHFVGSYGRCRVYRGMGDLGPGANTTAWIVDNIMDTCWN